MRPGRLAPLMLVWLAAALPAAASAATVTTNRACYAGDGNDTVRVDGSGFTPGADVLVLLDGKIIADKAADGEGRFLYGFAPPVLDGENGVYESSHGLELREQGATTGPATTFSTALRLGDFNPGSGDPRRLRVRFSAFGFAVGLAAGAPMPTIYVHYVDPRRRLRRTISLGTAKGPCGSIPRTARRRLFFAPRRGLWTLQFDTNRAYRRNAARSYRLPVSVR